MHWEVGVAQRRATYTVADHTTFRADIGVAELIQKEGGANASEQIVMFLSCLSPNLLDPRLERGRLDAVPFVHPPDRDLKSMVI